MSPPRVATRAKKPSDALRAAKADSIIVPTPGLQTRGVRLQLDWSVCLRIWHRGYLIPLNEAATVFTAARTDLSTRNLWHITRSHNMSRERLYVRIFRRLGRGI